mmetsp:Transcript_19262/g.51448  ORF Transcript_19262/g.51448 Transcript_19262/m.51448 type:complete len:98 (+) Transcript_19262:169-462(+)
MRDRSWRKTGELKGAGTSSSQSMTSNRHSLEKKIALARCEADNKAKQRHQQQSVCRAKNPLICCETSLRAIIATTTLVCGAMLCRDSIKAFSGVLKE